MVAEAEQRALYIANQARSLTNVVYAIGMGSGKGECGLPVPNMQFLQKIANDPNSPTFNPDQPIGLAIVASDASHLREVFDTIASQILMRLTK